VFPARGSASVTDAFGDISRRRRDVAAIRVALALSVLVHVAVLWKWVPQILHPSSETSQLDDSTSALSVELRPRASRAPAPPAAAVVRPERAPSVEARPVQPRRRHSSPPIIALNRPSPDMSSSAPAASARSPPAPVPRSAESDLASYVESRRRARGESAPPEAAAPGDPGAARTEDENARANRLAAANLGSDRKPTFGPERRGGGIFQVQHMSYDYAEFLFFGWNKDIRRNTQQLIEVRKGSNSDIRIAIVRRMIAIIREYEDGDFIWESRRLGRNVILSARAKDNAGLEEFMMREFF
jgi:hypothetical protein